MNRNEEGTNRDGDEPHKLDVVGKGPALLEVMLDTNAIDALTDDETLLQIVEEATAVGSLRLVITHAQTDEIAEIADAALRDRRQRLTTTSALSSVFVLDVSRLDMARLGEGVVYSHIHTQGLNHAVDGVIADTAASMGLPVVTADRRLRAKCRTLGIAVMSVDDLVRAVGRAGTNGDS